MLDLEAPRKGEPSKRSTAFVRVIQPRPALVATEKMPACEPAEARSGIPMRPEAPRKGEPSRRPAPPRPTPTFVPPPAPRPTPTFVPPTPEPHSEPLPSSLLESLNIPLAANLRPPVTSKSVDHDVSLVASEAHGRSASPSLIRQREARREVSQAASEAHGRSASPSLIRQREARREASQVASEAHGRSASSRDLREREARREASQVKRPGWLQRGEHIGPYQVEDRVGAGGFGALYRVTRGGKDFALKVPLQSSDDLDPADRADGDERLAREVGTLLIVRHPNIVRVREFFRWPDPDAGFDCIVMDFIAGRPFYRWVRETSPSLRVLLGAFAQLGDALDALHRHGIFHRDLKSGNVLVASDGHGRSASVGDASQREARPVGSDQKNSSVTPVVVDFGIARPRSAFTLTGAATLLGTYTHWAPEYVAFLQTEEFDRGVHFPYAPTTDLYALGNMLYGALCGREPHWYADVESTPGLLPGVFLDALVDDALEPPSTHQPLLPPEVDALALQLLAKKPAERFQSGSALKEAVEALLRLPTLQSVLDRPMVLPPGPTPSERSAVHATLGRPARSVRQPVPPPPPPDDSGPRFCELPHPLVPPPPAVAPISVVGTKARAQARGDIIDARADKPSLRPPLSAQRLAPVPGARASTAPQEAPPVAPPAPKTAVLLEPPLVPIDVTLEPLPAPSRSSLLGQLPPARADLAAALVALSPTEQMTPVQRRGPVPNRQRRALLHAVVPRADEPAPSPQSPASPLLQAVPASPQRREPLQADPASASKERARDASTSNGARETRASFAGTLRRVEAALRPRMGGTAKAVALAVSVAATGALAVVLAYPRAAPQPVSYLSALEQEAQRRADAMPPWADLAANPNPPAPTLPAVPTATKPRRRAKSADAAAIDALLAEHYGAGRADAGVAVGSAQTPAWPTPASPQRRGQPPDATGNASEGRAEQDPQPRFDVPLGAELQVRLQKPLDSRTAANGPVVGRLTRALTWNGRELLPAGTFVYGTASTTGAGRFDVRFSRLRLPDQREVKFEGLALDGGDRKAGLAASRRIALTSNAPGLFTRLFKGTASNVLNKLTGGDAVDLARGAGETVLSHEKAGASPPTEALLLDAPTDFRVFVMESF